MVAPLSSSSSRQWCPSTCAPRITAPFGAQRFINDHQDGQLRCFCWRIPDKGGQDLAVTVATMLDFLRCPRFASHCIALYCCLFAGAALDYADQNVVDAFHGLR